MKVRNLLIGAALIAGTAVISSQVLSQEHPDHPKKKQDHPAQPGQQQLTPEQQAEMQKWTEFATPGKFHQFLQKKTGKWNLVVRMWHEPDAPADESTATSEAKLIMGGRYLFDSVEGSFMGDTFQGTGITAYDNLKKKFVTTWIDNMGTGIMYAEGTCNADGTEFTYAGELPDPVLGKYKKCKTIERLIDANSWKMETYEKNDQGKEWKTFEIIYTRAN